MKRDGHPQPYWMLRIMKFERSPNFELLIKRGIVLENSKAINAIFSVVDESWFKLIFTYDIVKKAWDTLRIVYKVMS